MPGTGSGRGSLSLMSQGQVDQILNSKPSYRREVFEEAAGISKYRARQKEAMYQLTKMERDVAYLSQIAAEIESNMYLLKNEAQKAQEYLEVRKEKNYLESVLITRDMTRLYRETAVCRYQKEAVSLALEKIELQENRFQQLLQGPAQELRVKREHKEEAAREEVRLQLEKEHLADRLAIAWERKTWLEKRVQECTVFLEKSSRDLKDLIYKKEAEKESLEKLRQEIKDCRVDLDLQKQQSDAINSKIMLTERKSKRINGEYVEALSIKAQIGNKLSSVEKELSMTEKETDSSAARLKGLRENCMKLDSKIVSDRKICTTLHKKLETLTQENAGCEEKVKDLEHRLVQVQHELQNARDNHVQVKSKQKLLAEMHKKYEGYAFPVQELLKHGHELPGICGVVGDLLEVPEKYRIAVEIALGAKVNNIVTETTETAKEAIQFLKKRNAGRLTFLPLDVLHSKGQAEMKSLTGIRLASQVVKIEAQYQAVADYLLGRILVVEDLEAGLQAAGKTGYKFTIVTEKGEMLHPGGALTGGSLKKGSGGLVGRKKTIEQLSGEATRLSDKISAINMTKTDIEKAIAQEREKSCNFSG